MIPVISAIAVVVSIGGICPQIVAMAKARSSAGQSALGWCLGVLVNGLLGYVNLVGTESVVLTTGNAIGLALSALALALTLRYRPGQGSPAHHAGAVSVLLDDPRAPLADLETGELEALHGAVIHAYAARGRSLDPDRFATGHGSGAGDGGRPGHGEAAAGVVAASAR